MLMISVLLTARSCGGLEVVLDWQFTEPPRATQSAEDLEFPGIATDAERESTALSTHRTVIQPASGFAQAAESAQVKSRRIEFRIRNSALNLPDLSMFLSK